MLELKRIEEDQESSVLTFAPVWLVPRLLYNWGHVQRLRRDVEQMLAGLRCTRRTRTAATSPHRGRTGEGRRVVLRGATNQRRYGGHSTAERHRRGRRWPKGQEGTADGGRGARGTHEGGGHGRCAGIVRRWKRREGGGGPRHLKDKNTNDEVEEG